MREISFASACEVYGGVDDAEANQRIGVALGTAYHAMTSTEATIGSILGIVGMVIGASIHMSKH